LHTSLVWGQGSKPTFGIPLPSLKMWQETWNLPQISEEGRLLEARNFKMAQHWQTKSNTAENVSYLGLSTLINLLESVNDWTFSVQYKESVTVAYVDFSKAFHNVVHTKLNNKLSTYSISSCLSDCLENFSQIVLIKLELACQGLVWES